MTARKSKMETLCDLCNRNPSKYCCPRCELFYCSLDCYKSENHIKCSESFYRDCVNEELTLQHVDTESKGKMEDILKKMYSEEMNSPGGMEDLTLSSDIEDEVDSDDDDFVDLHDRINNLNLDDADAVWNALTQDEKNEFEALLSQGNVESIIPLWEPWWTYKKEKKIVEHCTNGDTDETLNNCPKIKSIPKLNLLTSIQPSTSIKFNIVNVLATYAFVMRYFNGDVQPSEATANMFNISANLDNNTNFEDLLTALESVSQKCFQSELLQADETNIEVMKQDTFQILQGPCKQQNTYYCKAALSHLHTILEEAKSAAKYTTNRTESKKVSTEFSRKFPDHEKIHLPTLDVTKIKISLKKIEYYLSYVDTVGIDLA